MSAIVSSYRGCLFAALTIGIGACAPHQVTLRSMVGVTGGGVGESWIVVEETSGRTDREYLDENRYVVYRCAPNGCVAVGVLRGNERQAIPRGAYSPTTIPTAPNTPASQ
jgi:hypothetical protein